MTYFIAQFVLEIFFLEVFKAYPYSFTLVLSDLIRFDTLIIISF